MTLQKKRSKRWNVWIQRILKLFVFLFFLSVIWAIILNWINPPFTYLMVQRKIEAMFSGNACELKYSWKNLDEMSAFVPLSAIAAEDQNFATHNGFDFEAIKKAYEKNKNGKKLKGASTISQQVAKNVFLWPGRSWLRKGFEVYFTILIEIFWPKERIVEVYVNVAEMGPCIFGAEAASQAYFNKSAKKLTRQQASLIAATLPNPIRMNASRPSAYVWKRCRWIERQTWQMGGAEYMKQLSN